MYVFHSTHFSRTLAVESLFNVCDGIGQRRAVHRVQHDSVQVLVVQVTLS